MATKTDQLIANGDLYLFGISPTSTVKLQYRHELNDTFRAKSTARFRTNLTDKISDSRAKSRRSFHERMRKAYVKLPIKYREISRNIAAL